MTTSQYAQYIRGVLDINRYSSLITSLGNSLNSRKNRFDKSDIIEQAFSVYTGGLFEWIDQLGRDHLDTVNGHSVEFKYANCGLYTPKGNPKLSITVKIMNSQGNNVNNSLPHPADYYIISQADAMAVISYSELQPYLRVLSDGIEAKIPTNALSFVFLPTNVVINVNNNIDYLAEKRTAQRQLIENF
jgi:hypothetical protein